MIGTEGRLLIFKGFWMLGILLGIYAWIKKSWWILVFAIAFLTGVFYYLSTLKCLRCGYPVWRVMIFRNMLPAKCPECRAAYE
ncbi:MAG: hypothetical protein A4E19_11195 [Nitrospira sp. SG-bin1]|nr:MAG: hypothetical protein A4E19_11195 [Nitrospira sp. SG-bin1]